jgi:hypothetical protein
MIEDQIDHGPATVIYTRSRWNVVSSDKDEWPTPNHVSLEEPQVTKLLVGNGTYQLTFLKKSFLVYFHATQVTIGINAPIQKKCNKPL